MGTNAVPTNAYCLMHFMKVLVRTLMLTLNITLWLFVLYFSAFDDGKAAILSYVALALTVFTTMYTLTGMRSASLSLAGFISKVLISGGIVLVIFSRYWNTAFYLLCLGILILKIKYEMELRTRSFNIRVQEEDTKDDSIHEFIPVIPHKTAIHIQLPKVASDEMQLRENRKGLNEDGFFIFSSQDKKNGKRFRNIPEIPNKVNKFEITSERDYLILPEDLNNSSSELLNESLTHDLKENLLDQSNENIIQDKNTESENSMKLDEISRKYKEKIFQLISEGTKRSLSKMSEPLQLAPTEFDPSIINLDLQQTEANCASSEISIALSKTLKEHKSPDNELKQLNTISDTIELINIASIKVKTECSNAQVNTYSHVLEDAILPKDFSGLSNLENIKDEFQEKSVQSFDKEERNLMPTNEAIHLDIGEQLQKSTHLVNGITTSDPEVIFMSKMDSQNENFFGIGETSDLQTKYESKRLVSIKSDVQDEKETQNNFKMLSENYLASNVLSVDFDGMTSKINKLSNDAETCDGAYEPATKSSANVGATTFQTNPDIEGVVNRIDLSFIYAL